MSWSDLYKGGDGKPSLRRVFSIYFVIIFSIALFTNFSTEKLTIIAGIIVGLLGLTTAQNIFQNDKQISE